MTMLWLCTVMVFEKAEASTELAEALSSQRARLAERAGEMGGLELMGAYSDVTDALVRRVYDLSIDQAGRASARHVAIAAVGGYGRREMAPFSDVDVAFIVDSEGEEAVEHAVKKGFIDNVESTIVKDPAPATDQIPAQNRA